MLASGTIISKHAILTLKKNARLSQTSSLISKDAEIDFPIYQ